MENENSELKLDSEKGFEMLLDCMITSIATSHAVIKFFISETADGDNEKAKIQFEAFNQFANEQREKVILQLYESFGTLPSDILAQLTKKP